MDLLRQTAADIVGFLDDWQELVGAVVGAGGAFLLWWFAQLHRKEEERKEYLLEIKKTLADQANTLLDARRTVEFFVEDKLARLIKERSVSETSYNVDLAFFPLFSTRGIDGSLLKKATGSSFLDNKILRVYALSHDLPHIIEDLRKQFEKTTDFNKEMAFLKLNPPKLQSENYTTHLRAYEASLRREVLQNNIPLYLRLLVETLVSLEELERIGLLGWRLKFDARYKFFLRKSSYNKALQETFSRIEKHFTQPTLKRIEGLEKDYQEDKARIRSERERQATAP